MDESPRKVEHAKVPAASADPAADLAQLIAWHDAQMDAAAEREDDVIAQKHSDTIDAIERLLRERDAAQAHIVRLRHAKSLEIRRAEIAEAERDAALRERDELMRRLKGDVGDVFLDEIHGDV